MTKASQKIKAIVSRYRKSNPIGGSATAITIEENPVAKASKKPGTRKKRRTPKQIAATKRLIRSNKAKAKAKKTPRKATKKKRSTRKVKKRAVTRKRRTTTKRRATSKALTASEMQAAWNKLASQQEAKKVAARKKTRKKTAKRRTTKKRTTRKRTTARRRAPVRRRRKAPAKRRRTTAAKRRTASARRTLVKRGGRTRTVRLKGSPKVQTIVIQERKPTRRRKTASRRRRNPVAGEALQPNPTLTGTLMSNSAYSGLMSNPVGAFSGKALMGLAVTGAGVGLGFAIADFTDRWIATRTPAESGGVKGLYPWYGQAAVNAMARKPDAMRLGAQAAGSVGSLALAYATRRVPILPWIAAGTSIGFASNLFTKLITWYLMPAIWPVKDPNEQSIGNRLYPTQQPAAQDQLDAMFDDWANNVTLRAAQQERPAFANGIPTEQLNPGQPGVASAAAGLGDAVPLVRTGHVGNCAECGGQDGCYTTCPGLNDGCMPCQGGDPSIPDDPTPGQPRKCAYVVQFGDDIYALAAEAGVDVNVVNNLNSGVVEDYWKEGNEVVLPYAICNAVLRRTPPDDGVVPRRPGVPEGGLVTQKRPEVPEGTVVLQDTPSLVPATPDRMAIPLQADAPIVTSVVKGAEVDEDTRRESVLHQIGNQD